MTFKEEFAQEHPELRETIENITNRPPSLFDLIGVDTSETKAILDEFIHEEASALPSEITDLVLSFAKRSSNERGITMEYTPYKPVPACEYKEYILVWIEKFNCYCILDNRGTKVREPYWSTASECKAAIDSGEAL